MEEPHGLQSKGLNNTTEPLCTHTTETFKETSRGSGEGNGNLSQCPWHEEFHGQRSLASYRPWGHEELNMTEQGINKSPHVKASVS